MPRQVSAVQALDRVALAFVDAHLRHGLLTADETARADLADELTAAIGRLTTRR